MKKNHGLTLIFITLLIDCIGFGIIIPVLPKLLQSVGDFSLSEASRWGGYLVASYAIVQFFFSPVLGNLSDKFGRKPILVISLLGLGVDYFFQALAPTLTFLFIGRLIAGVCGASFSTASAYIADVSTDENRSKNYGMIGIAFGLGFIIGPLIGGLSGVYGARVPFYVAGVLSLINATICIIYLPESLKQENRRGFNLRRANPFSSIYIFSKIPLVFALIIPMFLLYLASHAVQSNWPYYTSYKFGWSEKMIGISLAVVGIVVSFVQGFLIRYTVPKFGEKKSILYGFGFYMVGMLLFALAPEGYWMFVFTAVYCIGGIAGPPLQSIMAKATPANQQGELSGLTTSVMSLTAIFGPLVMNGMFSFFTGEMRQTKIPEAPMLLGTVLIFFAVILIYPLFRRAERKAEARAVEEQA